MRGYRKSRASYPDGVIGVYDNGGIDRPSGTFDRYTVVYEPEEYEGRTWFPYIGMSEHPFHPQGFGQHGELTYRPAREGCGRVIDFEDLPPDCQRAVRQDLDIMAGAS